MGLGDKQRMFVMFVAELIIYIYEEGYEVSFGDAYRDPRLHGKIGKKKGYGHAKSNHKNKLAIDLNLFKDGVYLPKTKSHRIFGEWWEKKHELCRWGGRFSNPDGNHYSFEHNGMM